MMSINFPYTKFISKITVGLIARHRSFLEQEHWGTVPWALYPWTQSVQSRLVTILIFVPGFLEDDKRLGREIHFAFH